MGFTATGAAGGTTAASCFGSTGRVASGVGLAGVTIGAVVLGAADAIEAMVDVGEVWARTGATIGLCATADGAGAGAGGGTVAAANCLTGARGVIAGGGDIGVALATTTGFTLVSCGAAASLIAGGATTGAGAGGAADACFVAIIGRGSACDVGDRSAGSSRRCDPSAASIAAGEPSAVAGEVLGAAVFTATAGGAVTGAAIGTAASCTGTGLSGAGFAAATDFGGAAGASAFAVVGIWAAASFAGGDKGSADTTGFVATTGEGAALGATNGTAVDARRCWPNDMSAGLVAGTGVAFATSTGLAWAGTRRVVAASTPIGCGEISFGAAIPFLARTGSPANRGASRDAASCAVGTDGFWAIAGASTSLLTTSDPAPGACGIGWAATIVGFDAGVASRATLADAIAFDGLASAAGAGAEGGVESANAGFAAPGGVTTGGAGLAAGARASAVGFVGLAAAAVAGNDSGGSNASLAGVTFGAPGVAGFVARTGVADASGVDSAGATGPTTLAWAGAREATVTGACNSAGTVVAGFLGTAVAAAAILPAVGKADTSRTGDMIGEALPPGAAMVFARSEAGDASPSGTVAGFAAGDGTEAGPAAR